MNYRLEISSVITTLTLLQFIICSADTFTVPVIDISSLFIADTSTEVMQNRRLCSQLIDSALQNFGFFLATGHGISRNEVNTSFSAAASLFSLPEHEKLKVSTRSIGGIGRGYIPFGHESGVASFFESKEGYSYGYPVNITRNQLERPNIWPFLLDSSISNALERLLLKKLMIAKAIAFALTDNGKCDPKKSCSNNNNDKEWISEDDIERGDLISIMRLFHYYPSAAENGLGSSPHTDWGYLTVILHDGTRGLQFWHCGHGNGVNSATSGDWKSESSRINGSSSSTHALHASKSAILRGIEEGAEGGGMVESCNWVDVPWASDAVIINAGDFLSILSDGKYKSPLHRVLSPPSGTERTSFVLFFYPSFETPIPKRGGYGPGVDGDNNDGEKDCATSDRKCAHKDAYAERAKKGHYNLSEYNTLLKSSTNGDSTTEFSSFGDYVVQKWENVYRK